MCFSHQHLCERLLYLNLYLAVFSLIVTARKPIKPKSYLGRHKQQHIRTGEKFLSKFLPFVHVQRRPQHSADQAALEEISVHHL